MPDQLLQLLLDASAVSNPDGVGECSVLELLSFHSAARVREPACSRGACKGNVVGIFRCYAERTAHEMIKTATTQSRTDTQATGTHARLVPTTRDAMQETTVCH